MEETRPLASKYRDLAYGLGSTPCYSGQSRILGVEWRDFLGKADPVRLCTLRSYFVEFFVNRCPELGTRLFEIHRSL